MTSRALRPAADPPSRRRFGGTTREAGLSGALLHTLPRRAVVIGLPVQAGIARPAWATGALPPFLRVVDTVAGLATAAGATFFIFRLSVIAKRRLLWRVR